MSAARTTRKKKTRGQIWFVGAGPGDPELLTLRAVSALADADVVIPDTGVDSGPLLARCREDVEVVPAEVPGSADALPLDVVTGVERRDDATPLGPSALVPWVRLPVVPGAWSAVLLELVGSSSAGPVPGALPSAVIAAQ